MEIVFHNIQKNYVHGPEGHWSQSSLISLNPSSLFSFSPSCKIKFSFNVSFKWKLCSTEYTKTMSTGQKAAGAGRAWFCWIPLLRSRSPSLVKPTLLSMRLLIGNLPFNNFVPQNTQKLCPRSRGTLQPIEPDFVESLLPVLVLLLVQEDGHQDKDHHPHQQHRHP